MISIREQDVEDTISALNWAIGFMDDHKLEHEEVNWQALRDDLDELEKRFSFMLDQANHVLERKRK